MDRVMEMSSEVGYICGICDNNFKRSEKYPDYTSPPYIELRFAGHLVGKPLCPHCFREWKYKLKIKDKDFWNEE